MVADLVGEGLALSPQARLRWLEELGRTQPALAAAVRQALQARGSETQAYSPPSPAQARRHRAGERIGPYLLVQLVGSGGMGEVWLARRDDGAFTRDVALKLPLLVPQRRDLVLRFARERDILARLEHPHIARLYDAGIAEGQPYLAMELVQGQHITDFAEEQRLDLPARLELFLQVLAAVQYAHANLVLHRDIKPSNILVTPQGQARLLDFGVATLLDPEGPAQDTPLTQWSGRALTPAYASPEQILGQPLSTASDLYSLGVVLFELLTGTRPYRLEGSSPAEIASAIVHVEPPRPSAAVTTSPGSRPEARRLARDLEGDLDEVILRSLARRPEDRYPSVAALAEDLRRCLTGEPLDARSTSRWHRMERFVRRHRWLVLGATGAAAALLAVTTVAIVEGRRAMAEERRAQAEARSARAVRDFLTEVLSAADPASPGAKPPRETTVQEAVDAAASRIHDALDGQPREKIQVLTTLAGVYASLDVPDRSLGLFQQALALAESSEPVPNPDQAKILVELANTAMFSGRFEEAQRWVDRAEHVLLGLHDQQSEMYAQALKIRGNLTRRGATPDLRKAAELLERSATLFRQRAPDSEGRLGALFYLAQTLRSTNAPAAAEAAADEALELATRRTRPGFELANAYSLRAVIRDSNGKLAGAEADFGLAHQAYVRSTGPSHFLAFQNSGLRGMTLLEMGGRREEALAAIEASAQAIARVRRGSNTHAQAVERLGLAYLRVGRYERAVPLLEESRSLWAQRQEAIYRTVPTIALAEARGALGQHAEARALLEEALVVLQSSPRNALQPEGDVHLVRGLLAADRGEAAEAHAALAQALTLTGWESRGDLTRRVLAEAARVRLALAAGQVDQALAISERLPELLGAPGLRELPRVRSAALEARGSSLCRAGRAIDGEPQLAEAVRLAASVVDPASPPLLRVQLAHAGCLLEQGRTAEGAALLDEARRALAAAGPAGEPLLATLRAAEAKAAGR